MDVDFVDIITDVLLNRLEICLNFLKLFFLLVKPYNLSCARLLKLVYFTIILIVDFSNYASTFLLDILLHAAVSAV